MSDVCNTGFKNCIKSYPRIDEVSLAGLELREKCFIIIKHCAPDNQAILETQNCLKLDQTHQRDWFPQKYCGL